MKSNALFVAILENGRNLGFSIYQSDRIYLITIEMSHANFGACITNKVRYIHLTTSRCISIIYIKLIGLKRLSWHV